MRCKVQRITARQCLDMFRTVQHVIQSARPAAARIADPAILDVPSCRAGAGQGRAKMSSVVQIVSVSPVPAVNEDDHGMRARPVRYSNIAELQRVFAIRNARVSLGRRKRQNILGCE